MRNTKRGMLWAVIVDLPMMAGVGLLYFVMQSFVGTLTQSEPLPNMWLYIGQYKAGYIPAAAFL